MGCASLKSAKIFLMIASIILLWYAIAFMVIGIVLSQNAFLKSPWYTNTSTVLIIFAAVNGAILIIAGALGIAIGCWDKNTWTTVMSVFYNLIV